MVTSAEINGRVARLQQGLAEQGLDGALLILPMDIYYYSGTRQNGVLWVPAQGTSQLFIRKSLSRAQEEGTAGLIRSFPSSKEFPTLFPETAQRIGMTFDVVPVQQHQYYFKLLGGRDFVDISAPQPHYPLNQVSVGDRAAARRRDPALRRLRRDPGISPCRDE